MEKESNFSSISIAFLLILFLLFSFAFVQGCVSSPNDNGIQNNNLSNSMLHNITSNHRINIVVDIYPVEEFSKAIGGKYVSVTNILSDGASPHGFELTPSQTMQIANSDLFIYVGGPLDPWASEIKTKGKKVSLYDIYKKEYGVTPKNPHLWLDPVFDEVIVKQLCSELSELDPNHHIYYQSQANKYINKLNKLDNYAKSKLLNASLKKRSYITLHSAFKHFNDRYSLSFMGLIYPVSGSEISGQQMLVLINKAKQNNISYVYVEPQLNPMPMETLAHQINAKILVLDPVPSLTPKDRSDGKTFISIMYENIDNLWTGLK